MDVDVAIVRIRVAPLQPLEPENARHDEVLFPQEFLRRLNRPATLEHRPSRHAIADLVRDAELSSRGFEAAFLRSQTESRCGNRIFCELLSAGFQNELLPADGDADLRLGTFFHRKRR